MRLLRWDAGIARRAQKHASQCKYAHSTSAFRKGAGENIAQGTLGGYDSKALVQLWFDEINTKKGQQSESINH